MLCKQLGIVFIVLCLVLAGCGGTPKPKTYTIGVIVEVFWLEPVFEHFKEHMAELGYVEGQNTTYLYDPDVEPDQAAFDAEAVRLVEQKADLLFTVGTATTKAAKKAVEGTNIPVVFTPVINPVVEGVVDSLAHPGGNVTGVQIVDRSAKALEWALKIAPDAKHIYIPNNPADPVSVTVLKDVYAAIPQLGIELLPSEVSSVAEMLAVLETLPEDTLIFLISSTASLDAGTEQLCKRAQELGVPLFMSNRGVDSSLMAVANYTVSIAEEAKQGARMADRILKGAKPSDTPVETAEYFLIINLKNAQAIGLEISDDVLAQASTIIR